MKSPFLSRKFILTVAGLVLLIINEVLAARGLRLLDADGVLRFISLILGYVGVEGVADVVTRVADAKHGSMQLLTAEPLQYAKVSGLAPAPQPSSVCATSAKRSET